MKVLPKYLEIKLVTFNVLHRQVASHVHDDVKWVIDHWAPDVIGMQETEGYHPSLRAAFPGYGFYSPYPKADNSVMWRIKTMRRISSDHVKISSGQKHVNPDRYLLSTHFVTRTDGQSIWHFTTHTNARVDVGGHPRGNYASHEATKGFHRMANAVEARAKSGSGVVFWGGDFNVSEKADNQVNWQGFPNHIFHQHGMISVYDELHHVPPGRVIDAIGSCNADPGVKAKSLLTGPSSLHSDHKPRMAIYRIPRGKTSAGKDPKPKPDPTPTPEQKDAKNPYYPLPDQDFEENVPIPDPAVPMDDILEQPEGTWDHTVCCKK